MKKSISLFTLVLLMVSCKEAKKEVAPKDDGLVTVSSEQFQTMNMEIGTPVNQDFDVTVKASGRIDVPPQNRAKVSTFIAGYVKATKLLPGDKVTKGQALVTLESTEFIDIQKDFLEVAEQINYLKSEFERQKTLYNEKITSQKNYLKAESDYRSASGKYQTLRQKLILLNINPAQVQQGKIATTITLYAPISGDVTVVNANVGMLMAPSETIIEIVNNSDLHLELSVFEKDILKIKENQIIKFTVPEASKEVFKGTTHLIGKSVENTDRTINVHGHLDDSVKQKLLTGMFVEAAIVINTKKGFAIPKEALISENQKYFVLLLKNQDKNGYHFERVSVEKGTDSENFVEIIPNEQVNASSKLLTKGVFDIIN